MTQRKSLVGFLKSMVRRLRQKFGTEGLRIAVNQMPAGGIDENDANQRFSRAWYESLYVELGDGITCYRPPDEPDYSGGALPACVCCKPNTLLHLLPREEKLFESSVNATDFRLIDHPRFKGRKSLVCSKLGLCNGHKPFVCRSHPVYFIDGLMLFEEWLCRLGAIAFIQRHKAAVEHIRKTVFARQLGDTLLGYGRTARSDDKGLIHIDYEH